MSDRRAEELLVHAGWLRALALRLVRDGDVADDLVQDTWIATMRRTPERSESAKSWLAKVMLNRLRMRARSEGRRTAREQATLLIEDADVPTQDVLVARAEMQRKLVELVLRLDEPYRSTVLLHFCEGVPLASIARTQDVPASTVRWRLKTALDRLREGLDTESGGRKQWAVPLLAIPKGVLVAQKTSKIVVGAVVLVLLLLFGGWWVGRHRGGGQAESARKGASSSAAGSVARGGEAPTAIGADPERPAWLIQPDVKPRRVAGRVTFGGAPVAGATVELASLATETGLGVPLQRTTNAAGEFDFGPQPALELSVRASATHHASAALDVDLRSPRVQSEKLELVLGACDAAMFGTVRDASGGAVAKARIARLDLESQSDVPGGPAVVTDESGAYELCAEVKWPPSVVVDVSAAGYGSIVYSAMVPGRVKVDFALVPEATIVGRVVRDDTREAVAQAYVWIPAGPPGVQRTGWRATFTDASGHFRIDRVAPGSHVVNARAEGLAPAVSGVPVAVEAGQTSSEIEIRLEAGSTIRGMVVEDGKPVAGARVAAGRRTAFSQDDGSYVLTGVQRGDVTFTAMPYEVVKPQSFQVTQPLHDGVVLEVEPLGTITGRVVRGRDPIAGAAVNLNGPNGRDLDPVHTDTDGRFTARGLRAGPWDVAASSQHLGAFGGAETVQLARGETKDVTIELKYGASISGRVIDQNGAPVPGATVGFVHTARDDIGLGVTAMDGSFRAAMMTGGGQYRPKVSATPTATPGLTSLEPASGTQFPLVTLADGNSEVTGVVLAVRLDRLSISGTVVDADGAPVPDVRVVAERVEGNAPPRFFPGLQAPATTTDVDGHFTIGELLDGTYALRARSVMGTEGTLTGIRAGRNDIVFALPSSGGIDATIVGFKNPPQVTVRPTEISRSTAAVQGTLQGNVVSFRNLAPGNYFVSARNQTEGASTVVDIVEKQTARVTLTSKGSGVVVGRVREFRSGQAIEGMTCVALPRAGITQPTTAYGDGVHTDAQGGFMLDAPAGEAAVWCNGMASLYSDGLRMITVSTAQRLEIDVPVVAWSPGVRSFAGLGAMFDPSVLVPRLVQVQPGGPAATAGFAEGDVITAVDGTPVTDLSVGGVRLLVVNRAPGTKVKLAATRAGKPITGEVVLGPAH